MTLTFDRLRTVLMRRLTLDEAAATDLARRTLNYFGHSSVIIDNAIDPEDRRQFYRLHDAQILKTSWESILLPNGKNWRIFYWELNEQGLDEARSEESLSGASRSYESLPDEYWHRPSGGARR